MRVPGAGRAGPEPSLGKDAATSPSALRISVSVVCCSSIHARSCPHGPESVAGVDCMSPGGRTGTRSALTTFRNPSATNLATVVRRARANCSTASSRSFSIDADTRAVSTRFRAVRLALARAGLRAEGPFFLAITVSSASSRRRFAFWGSGPYFRGVKVALVILHADPRKGGAEGYTVNLAHALVRRGHDVTLVATSFGPQCDGVKQVSLDGHGVTRLGRYRTFVKSFDQHLATTPRYDVVHSITPVRRCDFYHPQAGLAAEALASGHLKHEGIRRPLDQLATRLNRKRQFVGLIEGEMLSGADAPTVLCVSDMVRRTALEHYPEMPEGKLVTLFNAVDPNRFDPGAKPQAAEDVRRTFGMGADKVVALIVAQDFKRKGLRPAIEAVARVPDQRLVLVVVGKPDPRPYQRLAAQLGVSNRVIFAGPTPDTYGFYRAADFFVLPTWHDPCSLVVLEALAMGLPTITTVQNGAGEVIEQGRHGYVLPDPSDIEGLAHGIRQLLDPHTRRAQREACLDLRPRLSYEHHLDQLEALYTRAKASSAPVARQSGMAE